MLCSHLFSIWLSLGKFACSVLLHLPWHTKKTWAEAPEVLALSKMKEIHPPLEEFCPKKWDLVTFTVSLLLSIGSSHLLTLRPVGDVDFSPFFFSPWMKLNNQVFQNFSWYIKWIDKIILTKLFYSLKRTLLAFNLSFLSMISNTLFWVSKLES